MKGIKVLGLPHSHSQLTDCYYTYTSPNSHRAGKMEGTGIRTRSRHCCASNSNMSEARGVTLSVGPRPIPPSSPPTTTFPPLQAVFCPFISSHQLFLTQNSHTYWLFPMGTHVLNFHSSIHLFISSFNKYFFTLYLSDTRSIKSLKEFTFQ